MTWKSKPTAFTATSRYRVLSVALGLAGATACADDIVMSDSMSTTGTTQPATTEVATTPGTPTTGTPTTTSAGTSASATTGGATTGGTGPLAPGYRPRWVLRDKDGVRIQAFVEPRCNYPYIDCWPLDFGSPNSFPCVRVISHEGKYINFWYNMEDGELGSCNWYLERADQVGKAWKELPGAAFTNDQCEGTVYTSLGDPIGGEFLAVRTLYFAADDLWFQSEEGCLDTQFWVAGMGTCNGPTGVVHLCPIVVIPDWVKTLLPNPPYSLAVEYD